MRHQNIIRLIISLLLPQAVGLLGSVFTSLSVASWYASLNKPFFTPPEAVFGPVWFILYLLMGISLFLIWTQQDSADVQHALQAFGWQLLLNLLWSVVFFGLRSPFLGLIIILLLWTAILVTIRRFYPISKMAAWYLVPYLLWVTFAALLNLCIVLLN